MKRSITAWAMVVCLIALSLGTVTFAREQQVEQDYLVLFKSNIDQEVLVALAEMGAEVLMEVPQIGLINVRSNDPNFIEKMNQFSSVQMAAEDIEIRSPETEADIYEASEATIEATEGADLYEQYQWDIKRVTNNGKAWEINSGNHSVIVGVIDTGVDFSHPDLQPNLLYGKAFFPGATPADGLRDAGTHGTHVAGAIGANGRVLGVAPNIGIASYRVSNNQGRMNWAGIMSAITTAADDGVFVANLSLGTYSIMNDAQDRTLHQSAARAVRYAQSKGMMIVGANGNDGINLTKKVYTEPGEGKIYGPLFDTFTDIPWVISVSSTTNRDTLAYYSNYGASNVDLAAPGGDYGPYWPNPERDTSLLDPEARTFNTVPVSRGSYAWMMGTSMAAPKVAAAIALVKAENPNMTPARIKSLLQQTADDLGKKGTDHYFGKGLVNVYNALTK